MQWAQGWGERVCAWQGHGHRDAAVPCPGAFVNSELQTLTLLCPVSYVQELSDLWAAYGLIQAITLILLIGR